MNINTSAPLYSPANAQAREPASRTQPQQNAPIRETPETRQAQETPSSIQPADRSTGPAEDNRRVESSPSTDNQQAAQRTSAPLEQDTFTNSRVQHDSVALYTADASIEGAPTEPTPQEPPTTEQANDQAANSSDSVNETDEGSDTREARPVVIDQQPNAATRTFLEVANQSDEIQLIDTFA